MGERSDQIERQIRERREELGEHISELQQTVKDKIDWRVQFERRPGTMLAVAFGGGLLLSALLGGGSGSGRRRRPTVRGNGNNSGYELDNMPEYAGEKVSDTWEKVKGALIGVAATQVENFLQDTIPGFVDQYKKASSSNTTAEREYPSPRYI